MVRPVLEVADILREHGPAWRETNRGHASLDQLKVMSAIERCRTAALGGHVARCENPACGHTLIAYNSCRNRHCPKCQAAASRRWLADREAELLPVPYFHVVYTLPSKLRDIAYQNKHVVYDLLMKAAAETTLAIAANPRRLGARIGITAVHAHLGLDPHPSSARAYDRARWRALARRIAMGRRPLQLPRARQPAGASIQRQDAGDAHRCAPRRPVEVLQHPCRACRQEDLQALHRPAAAHQVGRLLQGAVRGTEASAALSVPLHPPRRHFKPPPHCSRRRRRRVPLEGLSHRRAGTLEDDAASPARVHPALSHARAAQGLPPHPPLRALRQRQPRREHRNSPRTARRRPACRRSTTAVGYRAGCATRVALPMPALRRPHDRDRGVHTRLRAEVAADPNRERHVMTQTACQRRRFPVPLHRLHAGGDSSRQNHGNQPVDRPLIPFTPPPRSPLRASRTPSALYPGRLAPASRPPS